MGRGFVERADQIDVADVTILDKAVHCYRNPESLIRLETAIFVTDLYRRVDPDS